MLPLAVLVACAQAPAPAAAAKPAFTQQPVASVLDLMSGPVDAAADALWDSVGTESSAKGPVDKTPKTDADWAKVRMHAVMLAEMGNLLMVEGRLVARPGQTLENPPGEGDLTPEQSLAQINANRDAFNGFAKAMQDTALLSVKAIDARNVDALLEAGGALDEACEACHKRFWYPNAPAVPQ
jgi:hypothetical protein